MLNNFAFYIVYFFFFFSNFVHFYFVFHFNLQFFFDSTLSDRSEVDNVAWIGSRRTLITRRTINAINFDRRIFRLRVACYGRFLDGLGDTIFPKCSGSPQMLCYPLNTVVQSLLIVLPLKYNLF